MTTTRRWVPWLALWAAACKGDPPPPAHEAPRARSAASARVVDAAPPVDADIEADTLATLRAAANEAAVAVDAGAPADAGPTTCVVAGAPREVTVTRDRLELCFDDDGDDRADRCARVRAANGELIDTRELPVPRAWQDVLVEGVDGVDGGRTVTICTTSNACLDILPRRAPGDVVDQVEVREDLAYAAIAVSDEDGATGRLEVWDLRARRLRGRFDIAGLADGRSHAFGAWFVGDRVISVAEDHDTHLVSLAAYDLDGARPRVLGGGAGPASYELEALDRRTIAFVVPGIEEAATLVVQDVVSGRVVRRFTVTPYTPTHDLFHAGGRRLALLSGDPGVLRIELFDAATGARTATTIAVCP